MNVGDARLTVRASNVGDACLTVRTVSWLLYSVIGRRYKMRHPENEQGKIWWRLMHKYGIPVHMHGGFIRWILHGIDPEDFLYGELIALILRKKRSK